MPEIYMLNFVAILVGHPLYMQGIINDFLHLKILYIYNCKTLKHDNFPNVKMAAQEICALEYDA